MVSTIEWIEEMEGMMTLQQVLREAETLSREEQTQLIKLLLDRVLPGSDAQPNKAHSLRELRGLGKEIWEGVDAQEYINQQRDEWDKPR
jgi:hypothetical protein